MNHICVNALLLALLVAQPVLTGQSGSPSPDDNPTAVIQNGTVSGVHSRTYQQDFFLGIPYAQAPVHGLRFRSSQSLNVTFNGTFHAHEYSPSCVGYGVRCTFNRPSQVHSLG